MKPTMSAKRMLEIKKCILLKGIRWIESSGLLGANRQNCFIAFSSFSLVKKIYMCAEKEQHFVFLVIDDGCWGKPSMLCVRSQAHFLFPP